MRSDGLRTAVVGGTGAAGSTLLRVLVERNFPIGELRVLASERSAGMMVPVGDATVRVAAIDDAALEGVEIAFFAAGATVSRRFAPTVARGGGLAVDKSSAYRLDDDIPLIVPEVNPDDVVRHRGIVANPNCVTIPLCVVLAPLQRQFGLRRITLATYQAASGGGRALVDELAYQARADASGGRVEATIYPHILHGNVVPGGWGMRGDDTEEEIKVIAETRRVLGLPLLPISITTVRVPVSIGHSAAVWIECDTPVSPREARAALSVAAGIRIEDDPVAQRYPTPRDAAGTDDVWVGRIRNDLGRDGALCLFFAADNLRKGAATNAVQVAELALARAAAGDTTRPHA